MIGRAQQIGDENPNNKSLVKQGEVYVLGPKIMSSELEQLSQMTNNSFLKLAFNYKYDDLNDSEPHFFRSDLYNYARNGIPVISILTEVVRIITSHQIRLKKLISDRCRKLLGKFLRLAGSWQIANSTKG